MGETTFGEMNEKCANQIFKSKSQFSTYFFTWAARLVNGLPVRVLKMAGSGFDF